MENGAKVGKNGKKKSIYGMALGWLVDITLNGFSWE
jgi:hypothetical protein